MGPRACVSRFWIKKRSFHLIYTEEMKENCGPSISRAEFSAAGSVMMEIILVISAETRLALLMKYSMVRL